MGDYSGPSPPRAPWLTEFRVKEKYSYLEGLGAYHSSEAFPGANPRVINSPQKPSYGLKTERISGSSFTAPRHQTQHTWVYRSVASLFRSESTIVEDVHELTDKLIPDSFLWPKFPVDTEATYTRQTLLAANGDPSKKLGCSIWLFDARKDMPPDTAFTSSDGDALVVPHTGTLDIQTELGFLLVRQNEFAVIPRGVRYRVSLPEGFCRGYICELHQSTFRLPELGPIGTTGLANTRDFQIPTARFDGTLVNGVATASNDASTHWTILSRLGGRLWSHAQRHTPFDVAAWHGTLYPYKFDFSRYNILGNALFDEHDPSLYTVMSAPTHAAPGHSVVDFAIIPPRWQVAENTLWIPYYHRNVMNEMALTVIRTQDPNHPLNDRDEWKPFVGLLHGIMTSHGARPEELEVAETQGTEPKKVMDEGLVIVLFETEMPLFLSKWAEGAGLKNPKGGE